MILPKENVTDKKKIIKQLNKIYNLEEKSSKWYNLKKRYHRHDKVILILILFCFIIIALVSVILIISKILKIPIEISFQVSLILAIFASFVSVITFFINLVKIMDYPVAEFNLSKSTNKEDYYELEFSITNSGQSKLKLNFAAYFVEEFQENSKLDAFLYCDTENISQYLGELLNRIRIKVVRVYSLSAITKDFGVFFPHNYIHTESRLHKFDKNKIFTITFFFQTSHRIFYYVVRHLLT